MENHMVNGSGRKCVKDTNKTFRKKAPAPKQPLDEISEANLRSEDLMEYYDTNKALDAIREDDEILNATETL